MTATATIAEALRPGMRVFLPGSTGEVPGLFDAICGSGVPDLAITATFVPGVNPSPIENLPTGATFLNPFACGPRGAQASRRMAHLPTSYGAFVAYLRRATFDLCVLHVAPPDGSGRASLGPAAEFAPLAASRADRVIAVINPQIPHIPGAASVDLAHFAMVLQTDGPLRAYDVGAPTAQSDAIAGAIAGFIGDGAALQIGLGKAPDALLRRLTDRRGLRLQSGMLSDGVRALSEAGALDPAFRHMSCVHVGTRDHYDWLAGRDDFAILGCEHTHAPGLLAGTQGLVAVNGALSVDLFGQANLETLGARAISGVGGAADFARGASLAPGGISVVGLPAASSDGTQTRIVAQLPGVVSLPRQDIDVVATDYGAADLRGLSVMDRAARLIAIAAPQHRERLAAEWREMAAAF